MAAMRLNIPTVFVSGGPMEAGKVRHAGDAGREDRRRRPRWWPWASPRPPRRDIDELERAACPTCGSCSGMFTANSMNCLTEALGPGAARQRHAAGHARRPRGSCSWTPARLIVELCRRHYQRGRRQRAAARDRHATRLRERDAAGRRDGRLHQHRAAPAGRRARGRRRLHAGRHRPHLARDAAPVQGVAVDAAVSRRGRAPRRRHHGHPGRARTASACSTWTCPACTRRACARRWQQWDVARTPSTRRVAHFYRAAPGGVPSQTAFSQAERYPSTRPRPRRRLHPRRGACLLAATAGLRCSTATCRRTAASSRPRASTRASCSSTAPRSCSRARTPRRSASRPARCSRATWWSSATKARAAGPACRRCSRSRGLLKWPRARTRSAR